MDPRTEEYILRRLEEKQREEYNAKVGGMSPAVTKQIQRKQAIQAGAAPAAREVVPLDPEARINEMMIRQTYQASPELTNAYRDELSNVARQNIWQNYIGLLGGASARAGSMGGVVPDTKQYEGFVGDITAQRSKEAESLFKGAETERKATRDIIKDYILKKRGATGSSPARGWLKDIVNPETGKVETYYIDPSGGTKTNLKDIPAATLQSLGVSPIQIKMEQEQKRAEFEQNQKQQELKQRQLMDAERRKDMAAAREYQQELLKLKQDELDLKRLSTEEAARAKREAAETKQTGAKEKIYTETVQAMQGKGRVMNPATRQAFLDQYSTAKAHAIADEYLDTKKHPGGLNDIPLAQVELLVGEIAKIATGGVPHDQQMIALRPETLVSKWQQLLQKTGNRPTGAQLGEFVQNNLNYLRDMKKVSDSVVGKHQRSMYEAGQHAMTDEQRERIRAHPDFRNLFEGESPAVRPTPSGAPTRRAPKEMSEDEIRKEMDDIRRRVSPPASAAPAVPAPTPTTQAEKEIEEMRGRH